MQGSYENSSLLLLEAGDKHPLSFRRGKLLLPAVILSYGEKPREGAKRALADQLQDPQILNQPEYLDLKSYLGAHWDIVILFKTALLDPASGAPQVKEPYVRAGFYEMGNLPRGQLADDHIEVIESFLHPSEDE